MSRGRDARAVPGDGSGLPDGSTPKARVRVRWLGAIGLITVVAMLVAVASGLRPLAWAARMIYSGDGLVRALSLPAPGGRPINILLVGSDDRGEAPEEGRFGHLRGERADLIVLVRIDEEQVVFLHIPRDLRVDSEALDLLPVAALLEYGGPDLMVTQLRSDLAVPIHHYAQVGFSGFAGIVDAVGGVPIELDRPIRDVRSGLELPAGSLNLSGAQAIALVRARAPEEFDSGEWHPLPSGDLARVARQQEMITTLMTFAMEGDDELVGALFDLGFEDVAHDLTLTPWTLLGLANLVRDIGPEQVRSFILPVAPHPSESELVSPFEPPHLGGSLWFEILDPDAEAVLDMFRDSS